MRTEFAKLFLSASIGLSLFSCSGNSGEYISIPVKDVDYLGKCGPAVSGKPVSWSPLGCSDFAIKDSLCMIITSDPAGMLEVVSLNSNSAIGKFCTKGRAGNEFNHMSDNMSQPYLKDGDIFYPLMNFPDMEIKVVNVSESLRKGATAIDGKAELYGYECCFLDNDRNRQFAVVELEEPDEEIGDQVPQKYMLIENGVENEIKVFPKRMKGADDRFMFAPYGGAMFKHPSRNIAAHLLMGIDYIIFFDFENNRHFAIHQKGTVTYDDEYQATERDEMFFTDAARDVIYGLSRSTETIYTYPNLVKR